MPCDSSHMEANYLEIEISRLHLLIDEVMTGVHVNANTPEWRGYHPKAYCQGGLRAKADALTENLCSRMKKHPDVSKCSLELQMWWRDHQAADEAKAKKEKP